jgi:hypothetical protein
LIVIGGVDEVSSLLIKEVKDALGGLLIAATHEALPVRDISAAGS